MNGNTLKVVFTGIVVTLCFILIAMTFLTCLGKVTLELYKEIVTMLGIPTLIGMIVQAFIHADINKDGIPDYKQEQPPEGGVK